MQGQAIKCHNEATITGVSNYVGGICGVLVQGIISESYNIGRIQGNTASVGGICGTSYLGTSTIQDCYNKGSITGKSEVGGIAGTSHNINGDLIIQNCYNVGRVTGTTNVGQIVGKLFFQSKMINCYYPSMGSILAEKLGGAFIEDTTNINSGYPILKWQIR